MSRRINSREKGARGEREAAKYLRSLGFEGAYRTQQFCGKAGDSDAKIDGLDVFIEIKYGYPISDFDMGLALFESAVETAESDSAGMPWVILWKPKGKSTWRATVRESCGELATYYGDDGVRYAVGDR